VFCFTTQTQRASPGGGDGMAVEMPERICNNPIGFLGADDKAGIHAIILQPLDTNRYALEKGGTISHQRISEDNIFQ
jgi:hypothetical protein